MPTISARFNELVSELKAAHLQLERGAMKPVPFANQRERILAAALDTLAADFGVRLEMPLRIDSRGEFNLTALHENGLNPTWGCGSYGAEFAALLNQYNPRCGTSPGAVLLPENGWCYLNHFEVERMVYKVYDQTQAGELRQEGCDLADVDQVQAEDRGVSR